MDDDIAEQLARRDRLRRRVQEVMTPAQRMDVMRRMQRESWAVLSRSPEGYAHFMRRNFKKRAIAWREHDAR